MCIRDRSYNALTHRLLSVFQIQSESGLGAAGEPSRLVLFVWLLSRGLIGFVDCLTGSLFKNRFVKWLVSTKVFNGVAVFNFNLLSRHEMHHHYLISKGNRDRCDLKDIFPVVLSEADKTDSNTAKLRRPLDLFRTNRVFLSVDPDFSSLAVKDLRPDQHWSPIADGNPISLD